MKFSCVVAPMFYFLICTFALFSTIEGLRKKFPEDFNPVDDDVLSEFDPEKEVVFNVNVHTFSGVEMISGSVRCYGTKRNYVHSFMDVFVLDTVDDICKRSKDKMVTGTINDHTVTLKLSELGSKLQEVAKQIRAENEEKQKKTET